MSYEINGNDTWGAAEGFLNVPGAERKRVKGQIPVWAPHILVIDDDPLFRAKVRRVALKRNLQVTVCSSLREVDTMCDSRLFDIAIVDYYLDDMRSYLRGTDIAGVFEGTPVILISNTDHGVENNSTFPDSVRRFVNKRVGIKAILDTAISVASPGRRSL